MFLRYKKLQHLFEFCLSALTQHHNRFSLVYCPVDDTSFEVSPEISCSGVSSRYCCYGNHAAGSKPILKLFIEINGELHKVSL